jgi:hypothetical protein
MKRPGNLTKRMGAFLAAGLMMASLALPLSAQESQDEAPLAVKLKSEKKAVTMSVIATLVPWAVFLPLGLREGHDPGGLNSGETIALVAALAIPVGPSLGYFYAGSPGRGLAGIGIRLVGLAGIVGGAFGSDNADANDSLMTAFMIAGACVTAGSYIYDFAGLKKAVRRHNLKVQKLHVALAPVVLPKIKACGLQIQIGF